MNCLTVRNEENNSLKSEVIAKESFRQFVPLSAQELSPAQVADAEIIQDLQGFGIAKRKAEEQLFSRYSYFITLSQTKYALSNDELFDAYSDTILAVIHSIVQASFKNESSLKTFTYKVYHNKCVDLVRKRTMRKNAIHRTVQLENMDAHLSDNTMSIIEKLILQSDIEILKDKIKTLSETYQQVLLMSADGYSDKEIAEKTKFKNASVAKTSRLRALKKLRELI